MKTTKLGGKTVEIYDAIEELPVLRFHKYNKMLLVDSGIGSDLSDFDRHIERAVRFMVSGDVQKATKELENMRQNVYMMMSETSPKNLAFAALVKSVDGKECNDLSDDGLRKTCGMFEDVKQKEVAAELEAAKKKIDSEMMAYFPALFDDSAQKEYYDKLRRRTLAVLKSIEHGGGSADEARDIDGITGELLTFYPPQSFTGKDNAEINYDRQFENMCLVISQNLHTDPKKYTALAYFNAFEYIKEMQKDIKRKTKAK